MEKDKEQESVNENSTLDHGRNRLIEKTHSTRHNNQVLF